MPARRLPIIGSPVTPAPLEGVLGVGFTAVGAELSIEPMETRPHQLPEALAEIRGDDSFAGALIAAPHKEKAPPLTDALSDDARISGAVNVIVRDDGRLRGHNTDVDGVRSGLVALFPRLRASWPQNAVVLGAGGGARAVASVLIGYGFGHIAVFNRHLHKAEALVAHFARGARRSDVRARPWHEAIIEAELGRAEVLVNASGIGVREGESPIPADLIPEGRYVLDLVLHHAETPLMAAARERGGTVANGQGAFLEASAQTVRLLAGAVPGVEVLRAALAAELGVPEEGLAVVGD